MKNVVQESARTFKVKGSERMEDLKPCPFCSSREVKMICGLGTHEKQHMIICKSCGATVSFEDKVRYLAVEAAWNKRKWENANEMS